MGRIDWRKLSNIWVKKDRERKRVRERKEKWENEGQMKIGRNGKRCWKFTINQYPIFHTVFDGCNKIEEKRKFRKEGNNIQIRITINFDNYMSEFDLLPTKR